jgi:hypothetical protein
MDKFPMARPNVVLFFPFSTARGASVEAAGSMPPHEPAVTSDDAIASRVAGPGNGVINV